MLRPFALACLLLSMTAPLSADDVAEVMAGDLKLKVPAAWKKERPTNNLRLLQYSVDAASGDTEGAEFLVTPPIGGSTADNIGRWLKYFKPEGRKVAMTRGKCEQGEYIFVDLSGTYVGPSFTPKNPPGEGFRMYGVIFTANAGGNYFFRLAGPTKTVEAQATALRTAFGADKDKEEKFQLED